MQELDTKLSLEQSDDWFATPTELERELSGYNTLKMQPRHRGPVQRDDGRVIIGKVGAPARYEATSRQFFFWVPDAALIEVSQIVTVESQVFDANDQPRTLIYHALIDEVMRSSRRKGMGHEYDEADGDLSEEPQYQTEGMTFAQASILRVTPPHLTPPRERSPVLVAGAGEAQQAYNTDLMKRPLPIGLIKNGGEATAGAGSIDLDYLLGENGGHLNVTGTAGLGTKSSFLLTVVYLLHKQAQKEAMERPSDPNRLRVVPIVFNVKNYDLFHLDRANRNFDPAKHGDAWKTLGVDTPGPFHDVTYFAPQQMDNSQATSETGRSSNEVKPYSWSLSDVMTQGLFPYLFSEDDAQNDNFAALLLDLEDMLVFERGEKDGTITRSLQRDMPQTFKTFLDWLREGDGEEKLTGRKHNKATIQKLVRRLMRLMYESRGVLRLEDNKGNPLMVTKSDTCGPQVIDLNTLAGLPGMQKFVLAAVLQQLIQSRTGRNAQRGLRYLVVLDELNRFAPSGGRDPITRLIETVAAEMRSQGILLFGAQQQASLVSTRVVENAATRAIGQTGSQELAKTAFGGLSASAKNKAEALPRDEKLILQSGFRQPLHLRIPFPAWAMNSEEAIVPLPQVGDNVPINPILASLLPNP